VHPLFSEWSVMVLPRVKPASEYFHWPSGIILRIQCLDQLSRALQRELGAFQSRTESKTAPDARIVLCRRAKEMPLAGEMLKGRYKGMPWTIVCDLASDAVPSYFFYAPFFSTFLFVRTCLIPILKKITIEKGGFFLIGSAFKSKGSAVILFGNPGSGKTRLLLEMLDGGREFLGDSELMLTADKKIFPAFDYVEARLKTLYGTSHWNRLSRKNKIYLWFCYVLSKVSLGRISFNLLLSSVDNPWMARAAALPEPFSCWLVLQLKRDAGGVKELSAQDFLGEVKSYETRYQQSFGDGLYTSIVRDQGLSQLKTILSGASLWRGAAGQTAHDFLQREMKQ